MKKHIFYFIIIGLLLTISPSASAQKHHKGHNNADSEVGCPLIDSIIAFSKTKLGSAYRAGGTGPNGFDCSGFMFYTFSHFNIKLGRSSRDQFVMGEKVEKKDIRPGDLVFWYRGKGYIGHVGMVVEVDEEHNFKFIHSATYGKGVRYDYSTGRGYAATYAGARRIIDCDSEGHAFMKDNKKDQSEPLAVLPVHRDTNSTNVAPVVKQEPPVTTKVNTTVYHKIRDGETLYSIAKKHHVTVDQIKQWNHLKSDMIRAGSSLKIIKKVTVPVTNTASNTETNKTETTVVSSTEKTENNEQKATPSDENNAATKSPTTTAPAPKSQPQVVYHKIKQGETLSTIARKYHVTVDQIKKWNNLKSDMIRADAKLKIYKK